MSKYELITLVTDFICIEENLVHFSVATSEEKGSIDKALATLSPEESRRSKRSFRKHMRKCMSKREILKSTQGAKRRRVMGRMRWLAWERVNGESTCDDNLE